MQKKSNRKFITLLSTLFLFLLPALSTLTTFISHEEENCTETIRDGGQIIKYKQNYINGLFMSLENDASTENLIPLVDLLTVKENSITEIIIAVNTLDADDYSSANWQEINRLSLASIEKINNGSTLEEINVFLTAGQAAINSVLTLEQIAANAQILREAKLESISFINETVNVLDPDDYNGSKWLEILEVQRETISNIMNATSVSEVNQAKEDGLEIIGTIKTIEQITKELLEAKNIAINEIKSVVNSLNQNNYYPSDWQTILNIQNTAIAAINDTKYLVNIDQIKDSKLDEIQNVKTIAQIVSEQLRQAKDQSKVKLAQRLLEIENPSLAISTIVNNAQIAIEGALTIKDVEDLLAKAYADIDAKLIEEALMLAKQNAKKELDNYLQSFNIISEAVKQIITNAKVAFDNTKNINDLPLIVSNAIEQANLQIIKEEAIIEINEEVNKINPSDYSATNYQLILNEQQKATNAINNSTTESRIELEKEASLEAIRAIKPFKEELGIAKQDAKDELDKLLKDDSSDAVKSLIEDAKAAIEEAVTLEKVSALLVEAKASVEAKVAEELATAAALQAAKDGALATINNNFLSLTEADYSEENWNTILLEHHKASGKINDSPTIEEVGLALDTGLAAIEAVKTLAEIAAEKLQVTKDNAKLELDNYVENPSEAVQAIIDEAKRSINDSLTEKAVTNLLAETKALIDAKVAEEQAVIALQDAKDEANYIIAAKVLGLDKAAYSEENWNIILSKQTEAITAINRATIIEGIELVKDAGLAAIEAVKTLAQIAAEQLCAAKDNALLELETYVARIDVVSDYIMNLVTQASTAIENAKTMSAINSILMKVKTDVQTRYNYEVSEAKKDALNKITVLISSLDENLYSRKNWRAILDANDALIRALDAATKLNEVSAAKNLAENNIKKVLTIEQEIIKTARDSAKGTLDAYLDRIINPSSNIKAIVKEAKAAIDKETNPQAIEEILAATLIKLDETIAIELIEAKSIAIEEIEMVVAGLNKEDYTTEEWAKVLKIQKDYIAKIEAAKTADKVEKTKVAGIKNINEVLNPGPVCLWWLIMALSFVIIIEIVAIVNKKILDKKANKQITAFSLSIFAVVPVIIPSYAWLIISLELLTIVILFAYIIYLYRFNLKNFFTPKKKRMANNDEPNEASN